MAWSPPREIPTFDQSSSKLPGKGHRPPAALRKGRAARRVGPAFCPLRLHACLMTLMNVCSLTPFPLFHCPEEKPKHTNATKRKPSAAALPEGESLIDPYPLRWHARAFTDSLPPSIIPLFLTLGTSGLAQKATDPSSKRKKVAAGSSGLTEPERDKGRKEADDREQGGSYIMSAA